MIRKAGVKDLPSIAAIENSSFGDPWSRASLEAEFHKDFSRILIYEEDGIIAAYIIFWDLGEEAEIVTLAVAPPFRGRGIGSALVRKAGEAVPGASWRLEAARDNEAALNLYEKFGFIKTGIIKDYYGQGRDAYRMTRKAFA